MVERCINKREIRSIVEVGCGLGDIISNIRMLSKRKCEKIGIDREKNVLKAAEIFHP